VTAYSLRARLLALWVLLLASAAATAYLMLGVYDQSTGVQVAQADLAVGRACREIIDRYAALVRARGKGSAEADLVGTLSTALARFPGLEGGIWSAARGSVAYAYPTYEGSGPKTDFPAAERDAIAALNAQALRVDHAVSERRPSRTQVLMLQACPLHGPEAGLTAWSMTRAHVNDGPTYTRFLAGLGFLAVTVLGSAAFLSWFLYGFSGRIARLEAALAAPRPDGQDLPHLDRTGERELDRLVDALNAAGGRLREAQARIVATERLAAVGRLAASVAHEIRNPIAAMRLKAENALVSGDPHRTAAALMETGIDVYPVNRKHFRSKSFKRLKLEGLLTAGVELRDGGETALVFLTRAMIDEVGADEGDMDNISAFVGQIEGVKNGVTLTLEGIEWTPVGVMEDGSGRPASYTATASYSGQGWGSKTVGYKAILPYSGEVVKEVPGKMKYTVVYGEMKTAVQLETMDKSTETTDNAPKKTVPKQTVWLMAAGGVLLVGAAALGLLKRRGERI